MPLNVTQLKMHDSTSNRFACSTSQAPKLVLKTAVTNFVWRTAGGSPFTAADILPCFQRACLRHAHDYNAACSTILFKCMLCRWRCIGGRYRKAAVVLARALRPSLPPPFISVLARVTATSLPPCPGNCMRLAETRRFTNPERYAHIGNSE